MIVEGDSIGQFCQKIGLSTNTLDQIKPLTHSHILNGVVLELYLYYKNCAKIADVLIRLNPDLSAVNANTLKSRINRVVEIKKKLTSKKKVKGITSLEDLKCKVFDCTTPVNSGFEAQTIQIPSANNVPKTQCIPATNDIPVIETQCTPAARRKFCDRDTMYPCPKRKFCDRDTMYPCPKRKFCDRDTMYPCPKRKFFDRDTMYPAPRENSVIETQCTPAPRENSVIETQCTPAPRENSVIETQCTLPQEKIL
ncbi:uncharacterized protein LOC132745980 [Ruditapes philippinarum]|uniref:uncharacterized protein LOC132745980 n=1 Tax=Ruditapes philippinarum TaxID=129788 RepID=UPI00295B55E0|nr:uncharacterized protein LOC132745980 [Ruditapes philippinarum]